MKLSTNRLDSFKFYDVLIFPVGHLGVERNWLIEQAKLKLSGILYNRVLTKIIVRQHSVEYAVQCLFPL